MLDWGHFAIGYGGRENGIRVVGLARIAFRNRNHAILSIALYHSRVDAVEVDMSKVLNADVVARSLDWGQRRWSAPQCSECGVD